MGITVFLMLLIAVVMFFPRITEVFDGGVLYLVKEPLVRELSDKTVGRLLKKLKR